MMVVIVTYVALSIAYAILYASHPEAAEALTIAFTACLLLVAMLEQPKIVRMLRRNRRRH